MSSDLFAAVVGQPDAVAALTAAVNNPVHAYLFVGPAGSGKLAAAAAFAGELLAAGADDGDRSRELAAAWKHPDLVKFEPEGPSLLVKDAERITVEASRSPTEAKRKVIVIDQFHTAEAVVSASLLKTIEEPPPTTSFVILAEEVQPDQVTIASRCTTIEFGPVPDAEIEQWLVSRGVAAEVASAAAAASQGDLTRADLLANDPDVADRHELWRTAPDQLDGTGHSVALLVDRIQEAIDQAQHAIDQKHVAETAAMEEAAEQLGVRATAKSALVAKQKREVKKLRNAELRFGLAVLARRYRDDLSGAGDRSAAEAIDLLRQTNEALTRNPNETLQLQSLFTKLS